MPEENILSRYIYTGAPDIKDFKPQYESARTVRHKLLPLTIGCLCFLFACYTAWAFIFTTSSLIRVNPDQAGEVVLNDGTKALIHRGGTVFYYENYQGRHIELTGEASFVVEEHNMKPLFVSCGTSSVEIQSDRFSLINDDTGGELIGEGQ